MELPTCNLAQNPCQKYRAAYGALKPYPARIASNRFGSGAPLTCQARMTEACRKRGFSFETGRVIRKNSRYCRDCGPLVKLAQNAERKRELRRQKGWRAYRDEYSPFLTEQERKAEHRMYMRAWRAWRGYCESSGTKLVSKDGRKIRAAFIRSWLLRRGGSSFNSEDGMRPCQQCRHN